MTPRLTATATVRRAGRTVAVVDIDVEDGEGAFIAVGAAALPSPAEGSRPLPLKETSLRHEIMVSGPRDCRCRPFLRIWPAAEAV
jgi:hypothetical protein